MKRYIYRFMFILSTLALSASCVEKMSDAEDLAGRERTAIEVSYAVAGSEVKSVTVASASTKKTLEVTVNNDNLKWNLESNRDWCVVVPEEHCGSGTVTLSIAANEYFEAREPATLTFVAGDYRGFEITVSQSAASFIIGQPYFVSGITGGTYTVNVTTPAGTDWDFTAESWMEVTEGTPSTSDELTTTALTIKADINDGASRYGAVVLSDGEETGVINVYQFGTDLNYASDGSILLEGTEGAGLTLTAPAYVVNSVQAPKFATATVTENENGTSTVSVALKENLSDCSENREVELSLQLSNASASVVELPAVVQDYIPANGLVTGKGVMTFAQAVAAGASTADWEDNGVVTVKGDIDMSEVEGWTGIGTAEHPFTGQFNGGGYEFTNLKNTASGLFAYCEGATIKNVVLGKGCSFYFDKEYTGMGGVFGGIVAVAKETTVTECQFNGAMDFAGSNDQDEPAYIGGVVGYADEKSSVTKSRMGGTVKLSAGTSQMLCYVGGVAGWTEGTVTGSEMSGKLDFASGISDIVAGGVTSALPAKTSVGNNSFTGSIALSGSSSNVIMGGLYGCVQSDRNFDIVSDKSVTLGSIAIDSYKNAAEVNGSAGTEIFAGGFVGKTEAGVTLSFKGYECQTNISKNQTANTIASYICLGGVLGGCNPDEAAKSVSFENVSNSGIYSIAYNTSVTPQIARCFVGGVAGFVNGQASFKSCVNNGEIGKLTSGLNSANTKNYIIVYGGIAGVVVGGDAEFTSCENKAPVTNKHYSNCHPKQTTSSATAGTNGWYNSCLASGILGAFENRTQFSEGKALTMTSCVNSSMIVSYRGGAAGIIGYARNASLSSCDNFGSLGQNSGSNNNSAYKGGIACTLNNSTIDNCTAKCDVFCSNPASECQSPGGILGLSIGGGVSVTNCSYYGAITHNSEVDKYGNATPWACGCIVSIAEENTIISNCRFGGSVKGLEVTENKLSEYVTGNGLGQVSDITLWNGTL